MLHCLFFGHTYESTVIKGNLCRICKKCNKTYEFNKGYAGVLKDVPDRWKLIKKGK